MKIIDKTLECLLIEPTKICDQRGWFEIAFCRSDIEELGIEFRDVYQLNHSMTLDAGIIRGLNYQEEPFAQSKIVRCTKGKLYSVGVNIDTESRDFGKYCGFELSEDNGYLMYIPRTYAHGFIVLEAGSELEYFTDNQYSFEHAKSIRYDDPEIGIDWNYNGQIEISPILSNKNREAPNLRSIRR